MQDNEASVAPVLKRGAWNKGKLVGAKPPLRPKHVWSIRTKLQVADRKRDLAMFNLAIDSKLRGCDVVARLSQHVVANARDVSAPPERGGEIAGNGLPVENP